MPEAQDGACAHHLVGFCHEEMITDYMLDTGFACALITAVCHTEAGTEFQAEYMQAVPSHEAAAVREAMAEWS